MESSFQEKGLEVGNLVKVYRTNANPSEFFFQLCEKLEFRRDRGKPKLGNNEYFGRWTYEPEFNDPAEVFLKKAS